MSAGRLVIPELRWRVERESGQFEAKLAAALRAGAGGFVLSGGNADAVFGLTSRLRRDAGRPLLIGAALELGPGQRVTGLDELPPPLALASLGDPAVLRGAGVLTAIEALSVGINWVLAPVLDLDLMPASAVVQTRGFGAAPGPVSAAAAAWIIGCEAAGALACAKHFPGLGRATAAGAAGGAVVAAEAELLRANDLEPFRAAVAVGIGSIMMAPAAYPGLDATGTPASSSASIVRLLRDELGYGGLVVAELPESGSPLEDAALAAARAGVDLLLCPLEHAAAVTLTLERESARDADLAAQLEAAGRRYEMALQAAPAEELPERLPPAGSSVAAADWLLTQPLLRGEAPRLQQPLDLVVIDAAEAGDDSWVPEVLAARGVTLGPGGSRVVLALPGAGISGGAGFSPASKVRLAQEAPGATLVVLFAHPELLAEIPGAAPVLLAWDRQRLMQEGVARWLASRLSGER